MVLFTFAAQSPGGIAGASDRGGGAVVQPVTFSDLSSPMTRTHDPEIAPVPVTAMTDPFAVADTWKDVFVPLTIVAFRTK